MKNLITKVLGFFYVWLVMVWVRIRDGSIEAQGRANAA